MYWRLCSATTAPSSSSMFEKLAALEIGVSVMTSGPKLEECGKKRGHEVTWLHHTRLGAQVGQVDVSLPAIDDWVGVFAGPVCSRAVRHRDLRTAANRGHEEDTV